MEDSLFAIWQKNPTLETLDVSKKNLMSLATIMPTLLRMKNLRMLDLSENNLTQLPVSFKMLVSLEQLNLSGNLLSELPHLSSLYINLNTEEDVEQVIVNLKHLEILNGLDIDREELKKEQTSDEKDVFDQDYSQNIKEEEVEEDVPISIQQTPSYDYPPHMEEACSVRSSTRSKRAVSEFFEDQLVLPKVREQMSSKSQSPQRHATQRDMPIESLQSGLEPSPRPSLGRLSEAGPKLKSLEKEAEEEEKAVTEIYPTPEKQSLKEVKEESKALYIEEQDEAIGSRSEDVNQASLVETSQDKGDSDDLRDIFKRIRKLCKKYHPHRDQALQEDFNQSWYLYERGLQAQGLEELSLQSIQNKEEVRKVCGKHFLTYLQFKDPVAADVFEKLQKFQRETVRDLINLIEEKERDKNVLEYQSQQQGKAQLRIKALEELVALYSGEKEELQKQLDSTEAENKKLMDHMVKHSKANLTGQTSVSQMPTITQSIEQPPAEHPGLECSMEPSQSRQRKFLKNLNMGGSIVATSTRTLTLKQLKQVIVDIYAQKIKYDGKCEESHLPRETMEQFMYTYLNQRYGLKNLIIEWASAIIDGIRRFSRSDHDVALFGKIMRNECDEEFRFIQVHVKETIASLMKAYLKERHPHKSERDINKMIDLILSGSIQEWLWRKVVDKMYDQDDSAALEKVCLDLMKTRNGASADRKVKVKLTREEQVLLDSRRTEVRLQFRDFQKAVLDFQLKEHQRFLKKFLEVFRQIDSDGDGVLSEDEFRELAGVMSHEEEVAYFLQVIDPYNNKQMTFSEIVHLFSAHMVPVDDRSQVALLEKFAREDS